MKSAAITILLAASSACQPQPIPAVLASELKPCYQLLEHGLYPRDQEAAIRAALPYEKVQIQQLYGRIFLPSPPITTLYRDGRATRGDQQGQVSLGDFALLCHAIESAGFTSMASKYHNGTMDGGSIYFRVWPALNQPPIEVIDIASAGPFELKPLHAAFDGIASRVKWEEPAPKKTLPPAQSLPMQVLQSKSLLATAVLASCAASNQQPAQEEVQLAPSGLTLTFQETTLEDGLYVDVVLVQNKTDKDLWLRGYDSNHPLTQREFLFDAGWENMWMPYCATVLRWRPMPPGTEFQFTERTARIEHGVPWQYAIFSDGPYDSGFLRKTRIGLRQSVGPRGGSSMVWTQPFDVDLDVGAEAYRLDSDEPDAYLGQ